MRPFRGPISISWDIGRGDIELGASGIARQADLFEKIASLSRLDVLSSRVVAFIKEELNRVAAAINGSRTIECEGRKCFVLLTGRQRSIQSREKSAHRSPEPSCLQPS